jgi:hypothetical protein
MGVAVVSDNDLTYDQLVERGWAINVGTGIELPRFASVSLCLMRDGRKRVCIPGYGETKADALADAVVEANAWLDRQAAEEAEAQALFKHKGGRRRWTDPGRVESS